MDCLVCKMSEKKKVYDSFPRAQSEVFALFVLFVPEVQNQKIFK